MINESRIVLLKIPYKLSKRKVIRFLDNGVLMVALICQSLILWPDFPMRTYGFIIFLLFNIVPLARLAYKYFGVTLVSIVLILIIGANAEIFVQFLRLILNFLVVFLILVKTRIYGLKYYLPVLSVTIIFHFWAYYMQEFQQSIIYMFRDEWNVSVVSSQSGGRFFNLSRVTLSMSIKSGAIFYGSLTLYFLSIYYEYLYNRKFNFSCDHRWYRQEKIFIVLCFFASLTLAVCSQSLTLVLYFAIFFVVIVVKLVRYKKFKFIALVNYVKNTKNSILFDFTALTILVIIALIINTFRPSFLDLKNISLFGIFDYFNLLSQNFLTSLIEHPFGLGVGYSDIRSFYGELNDMTFIIKMFFEFGFLSFMIFILLVVYISRHIPYFITFMLISSIAVAHYSDVFLFSFPAIWLVNKRNIFSRPFI